jgi:hypothetical protein
VVKPTPGAHPASYAIDTVGGRALFPEVNWPGCEADQSSPPNDEVKNIERYTSTPT